MAAFLRGKQSGIQKDFSAGLDPQLLAIDEVARYGINSQVSALAYDPVQSLLAVGTKETKFGGGQIYVFGQKLVNVTLKLARKASVKILHFCADKLICVDTKNDLSIFSLDTTRIKSSFTPPGLLTALATDPVLDYALIGLQNGEIIAYDLDREGLAPLRIPNLWRERNPRARSSPIVVLAFHPRDIGTLLIAYPEGAVIFSFQQNKATRFFDQDGASARLTQALWHPTGTFILTGHEDSSFVIWDVKDGRKVSSRPLDGNASTSVSASARGTLSVKDPLVRIAWCSKENPDDTGLLFAGGTSSKEAGDGLTFVDLGPTPVYATSSWQILADHFERPKRQHVLPAPPSAQVVDFCLIPRKSPHFAGSSDPIAVIALLASGELITLSFPSGHPITPTNQLHVSLTYIHPFVNSIAVGYVDRTRWLGMVENRSRGPPILKGGAEANRSVMRYAYRNIVQTAHADGTIRLWDAGHGDEIENQGVDQVDVARSLGRYHNIDVTVMSISGATGELAVGLRTGEVVVFRWGKNRDFGRDVPHKESRGFGLESIADRAEPSVKEGLLPLTLLDHQQGCVTALKMSDVGFVCAGFEGGNVVVMDLRGPAVIYEANVAELDSHSGKRSSHRKSSNSQSSGRESPICISFAVMSLDGEDYSSILIFIGTNQGRLVTLKLLPQASGGYAVKLAGTCSLDDRIIAISPVKVETGEPADATQDAVASLRNGTRVNGVLLVVTQSGARIFKPATAKGAHKSWDTVLCDSAAVVRFEAHTYALLGLFGDGCAKAYSIPGLKEIGSTDVSGIFDVRRLSEAIITPTGFIFGWTGPSELAVLNAWGTGQDLTRSLDKLFNPAAVIPPRPTISNLQWISGTTHVTPADMDKLIGGPDRPPSKRMIEQMRADEQAQRELGRQNSSGPSSSSRNQPPPRQDEGYWAYMQRQIQERTENLGLTGDSMDKLEDNSQGWADDVNKYIKTQKKKAVMGVISSKLGL